MAFRTKKISQMDPKGAPLASTDLLEISELVSGSYVTKSITGAEIVAGASAGFVPYVGATEDLNLGDYDAYVNKLWLYDSVNDNYGSVHFTDTDFHIEDADGHKMLVIEDGFMQIHKTDTIQSNLFTSGLTATRNHYLPDASGTIALTSNLSSYVPTSRTLTINGTTQDLSADRTFTISTGITIGTTAITSGTVGRVLFQGSGNVVQQSTNLFWDATNNRLGIGTSSAPSGSVYIDNSGNDVKQHLVLKNSDAGSGAQVHLDLHNNVTGSLYNAGASLFFCSSTAGAPYGSALGFWNYQNGPVVLATNSTERMRISSTGNVLINTTTDAGFKLDVNGTARVSGNTNVSGNLLVNNTTDFGYRMDVNGNVRLSGNQNTLTGSVLIGTTYSFAASAVLKIDSTTQGFLPPRMTTTQKNAIASPATGLMVYDTTLNLISVYNGTIWISL